MVTASEYVQQFRHLRVLVIGDAMLDTYLEGMATSHPSSIDWRNC